MDIEELLKQQSTWIDRAQDAALQVMRRGSGTTPQEAGLETVLVKEIEDRIVTLEARREATLKAFDAAIEVERRSLVGLRPPEPAPARRSTAKAATPKRKGRSK